MKRNILYITGLLAVVLFLPGYSSAQPLSKDGNAGDIPVVVPKNPEMGMLGKFGNIPVSYYTGTPEISIPVYTAKIDNFTMPISLRYHAAGVQVQDDASWVGLNWDLDVAGAITVDVVGFPDLNFQPGDYATLMYTDGVSPYGGNFFERVERGNGFNGQATTWNTSHLDDMPYLKDLVDGYNSTELQPDIYHINVPGYSGKFVWNRDNGNYIPLDKKADISLSLHSGVFKLVTPDGIQYFFETTDATALDPTSVLTRKYIPPVNYLLTRIVLVNGKTISFTYSGDYSYKRCSCSESIMYNYAPLFGNNNLSRNYSQAVFVHSKKYLTGIQTPNENITLALSDRTDLLSGKKLDKLTVSSVASGKNIKSYAFTYDYFNAATVTIGGDFTTNYYSPSYAPCNGIMTNDEKNYRLKLTRLQETGYDGLGNEVSTTINPYLFGYNESVNLPKKTSCAQDHWGYYNGQNNGSTLPNALPYVVNGTIIASNGDPAIGYNNLGMSAILAYGYNFNGLVQVLSEGGANRGPNASTMQAGILNKITYPTKGYTEFVYEPHSFYNYSYLTAQEINNYVQVHSGAAIGGGLRVASITNKDADGTVLTQKIFRYVQANSALTSGQLMTPLNYTSCENITEIRAADPNAQATLSFDPYMAITKTSGSCISPSSSAQGSLVGYDRVEVYDAGNGNAVKGKTVYTYNNRPATVYFPQISFPSRPNARNGQLASIEYYRQPVLDYPTPTLLKKQEYTQKAIEYNTVAVGVIVREMVFNLNVNDFSYFNTHTDFHRFYIFYYSLDSYWYVPDRTIETEYRYTDITNPATLQATIVQTTTNTAFNTSGMLETRETTLSDGSTTVETMKYASSADIGTVLDNNLTATNTTGKSAKDQMLLNHMYDPLLFKQHSIRRGTATTVLSTGRTDFQVINDINGAAGNVVPYKVYHAEGANALEEKLSFDSWDTSIGENVQVSNYQGQSNAYVWGYGGTLPIAKTDNAKATDVFHTSFEGSDGTAGSSKTGDKYYNGTYTRSLTGLSAGAYVLSWWKFNPVSGKWEYNALTTSALAANGSYTISLTGAIDEVRFCPVNARMVTFTYNPLVGATSSTDENNATTYFEYDASGRLKLARDQDMNIIKRYQYHYKGQY